LSDLHEEIGDYVFGWHSAKFRLCGKDNNEGNEINLSMCGEHYHLTGSMWDCSDPVWLPRCKDQSPPAAQKATIGLTLARMPAAA